MIKNNIEEIKYTCILSLCSFMMFSCMNSEKREVVKVINSWIGKQVILPSHPTFTVMASDTVDYTFESSEYRILNYVDSTGCTACNLDLIPWEDFMNEVDLKTDKEVSFLYFYHTNKIKDVEFALFYEDFKHPVCIDKNGEILKLNDFPADITLHTFLLDNENKVLAIGNPIYNESIAKLYIDIINGNIKNSE